MKALKVTLLAVAGMFCFSTVAVAQQAQKLTTSSATQKPASAVNWKETTHDFGDIKKGTPVTHNFTFVNTTKAPVIISEVKPACGCTAADYTKTPVKPGDSAYIKATYNAAASGSFSKTISVRLNEGEAPRVLTIKGKVID